MKAWPRRWRVHHSRDPEGNCAACSAAFGRYHAAPTARGDSAASVAGFGFGRCRPGPASLPSVSPWRVSLAADDDGQARLGGAKLRCGAGRWPRLAPARRGQPDYWPQHDADRDGIACETWPGRLRPLSAWSRRRGPIRVGQRSLSARQATGACSRGCLKSRGAMGRGLSGRPEFHVRLVVCG
jgi:hypothetical protein